MKEQELEVISKELYITKKMMLKSYLQNQALRINSINADINIHSIKTGKRNSHIHPGILFLFFIAYRSPYWWYCMIRLLTLYHIGMYSLNCCIIFVHCVNCTKSLKIYICLAILAKIE